MHKLRAMWYRLPEKFKFEVALSLVWMVGCFAMMSGIIFLLDYINAK